MPTIIIVSGPGNTGKTSSIRQAMTLLGVHLPATYRKDVLLCAHLHLHGVGYNVGFASEGDTGEAVQRGINYFLDLNVRLDYLVFASRSRGNSRQTAEAFADRLGVQPQIVFTQVDPSPSEFIALKAQEIVSHIH